LRRLAIGTYTIDETKKTDTLKIVSSTLPNWVGDNGQAATVHHGEMHEITRT
jgi:hypothetical protein